MWLRIVRIYLKPWVEWVWTPANPSLTSEEETIEEGTDLQGRECREGPSEPWCPRTYGP